MSEFIAKYKNDFKLLEVEEHAGIHTDADSTVVDFANQDEVNHYKRNKQNLIFCALANILVCYHDIINGLVIRKYVLLLITRRDHILWQKSTKR